MLTASSSPSLLVPTGRVAAPSFKAGSPQASCSSVRSIASATLFVFATAEYYPQTACAVVVRKAVSLRCGCGRMCKVPFLASGALSSQPCIAPVNSVGWYCARRRKKASLDGKLVLLSMLLTSAEGCRSTFMKRADEGITSHQTPLRSIHTLLVGFCGMFDRRESVRTHPFRNFWSTCAPGLSATQRRTSNHSSRISFRKKF